MSIGLVSEELLQAELESLNPRKESHTKESHPVEIQDIVLPGRKEGDVNVPDSLRQIIGEESVLNGRRSALQLAKGFGISPSSVSAYAKGSTSTTTYDTPSKSIIGHINKSRQRAVKRAQHTLNSALNAITQDKLDYADPKDLASIAKDMTVVIKNLEPPVTGTSDSMQSQFVIFAPSFRKEETFETIVVDQ